MARRKKKKIKIKFSDLPRSEKIRRVITWIFLAAGVGCLSYFIFYVKEADDTQSNYERLSDLKGTDFRQNKNQVEIHLTEQEDAPEILDDYITLYNNNKSLVGWIRIDDTHIDYPVMQSKSNDYYLDHNFDQEKDNNGSIFIDSECSIWPRSQNIIIYGHNMKSGKMFGDLKNYKNEQFAKDHPFVFFDTLYEKGKYQVMYVFGDNVYDEVEVTFKYYQFINANSEAEWNSAMNDMSEKSLYDTGVEASYGEDIITLSTCDYEKDAERFVVVAKRVK
ncbi:MAG: class B sortase [Lachnospiraceae bacterium]|nr:class B sortase [Lachnospiraceae bacterium]